MRRPADGWRTPVAKAWLMGQTEVAAVRFEIDPEPDVLIAEEARWR
ncbi:MAG: hypothetical protein ACREEQ_06555 [Caulobacteraceae bacterium]